MLYFWITEFVGHDKMRSLSKYSINQYYVVRVSLYRYHEINVSISHTFSQNPSEGFAEPLRSREQKLSVIQANFIIECYSLLLSVIKTHQYGSTVYFNRKCCKLMKLIKQSITLLSSHFLIFELYSVSSSFSSICIQNSTPYL